MRVTFVLPFAGLSGGIRVVAAHAEGLLARGHDVTVVSTPWGVPRLKHRLAELLRTGRWPTGSARFPSHLDRSPVEHRVIDAPRPVVDDDVPDADVVVATYWTTAEAVAALSASKGAKAYFLQHDETFIAPGDADRVIATWRLPLHKIAVASWLVKLAAERADDRSVSLVTNGVDTRRFHAPPRGKQPRPTVGLMYSRYGFKACDVSLAAFLRVARQLPGARLVAFGAQKPDRALPLPSGAGFAFQPSPDQLRDLYASCDVWLCGSRAEGFHLPPFEAMACRCPVVSTRVGGPMDVIENGRNGFVVDVDDDAALADRLMRVLTLDEAAWREMSDAALATAKQHTWDAATTRFEAALREAVDKTRSGALASS